MSQIKTLNFIFDENNLCDEKTKNLLLEDLKIKLDKKIILAVDLSYKNAPNLLLDITYVHNDEMNINSIKYSGKSTQYIQITIYYFGATFLDLGNIGTFGIYYL